MPYIIEIGGPDDRSVSKDFVPTISRELKATLCGLHPLPPEDRALLPHTLLVGRPERGGIPDILGWSLGPFIVSQAVRNAIEDLEPGVQHFVPLKMKSKDGTNDNDLGTYHLIINPPQLDCVVIEDTDFEKGRGYRGFVGSRPRIDLFDGAQCTLSAPAIAGHHFWHGTAPFEFTYFCSDEFHDRIIDENREGVVFRRKCKIRLGTLPDTKNKPS